MDISIGILGCLSTLLWQFNLKLNLWVSQMEVQVLGMVALKSNRVISNFIGESSDVPIKLMVLATPWTTVKNSFTTIKTKQVL